MELDYIVEWFQFANMDLAVAEHLQEMHPQPLEIICYHCEQAAEKYLKGYLVYCGVFNPPKTHDLDVLCEMCSKYDEGFQEIKRACNVLAGYGVQPRYPHEMEILEHDMQNALEYARQIRDFKLLTDVYQEISQKNGDVG